MTDASAKPAGAPPANYEQRLSANPRWALSEGSIFFHGKGDVQQSLRRIADRLNALRIPYAIVGGMALFHHGVRRFTEDVDLLVTPDALKQIHQHLHGLGYVPPFTGSKNLRDAETGVKIEFFLTGAYPGDGKPKPIAFPDPAQVTHIADDIRYINLNILLELKLASGMTAPGLQKDLADVIALITNLHLPLALGDTLNEFVRSTYRDLWNQAQAAKQHDSQNESLPSGDA